MQKTFGAHLSSAAIPIEGLRDYDLTLVGINVRKCQEFLDSIFNLIFRNWKVGDV